MDGGLSFNNADYVETNFNHLIKGGIEFFLSSKSRSAIGFRAFTGGGLISGQNISRIPGLPDQYRTKVLFLGAGLVYSYATESFISPYLFLGLSYLSFNPLDGNGNKMPRNEMNLYETKELNYNGEVGLRFLISKNLSLNLNAAIYQSTNDNLDDIPNEISGGRQNDRFYSLTAGLSLILDTSGDRDNDGIDDEYDLCPDTAPGVIVDEFGCPPDTDGDGIPDLFDLCDYTPRGIPVNEEGCPDDSDLDGIPDYLDSCPDTPESVKIDQSGCPADSDGDGVPDYLDECPGSDPDDKIDEKGCTQPEEIPVPQVPAGDIHTGHIVNFDFGKTGLTPFAKMILNRLSIQILEKPDIIYAVTGYTDNSQSFNSNKILSTRRAEAVHDYLVSQDVPSERLRIFSEGSASPIADNNIEFGRTLNNRVEIEELDRVLSKPRIETTEQLEYNFSNEYNIEGLIFSDGKLFCIQVSSWSTKQKAIQESSKLNKSGHRSFIVAAKPPHKSGTWFRVRIGYFKSLEQVKEYLMLFK